MHSIREGLKAALLRMARLSIALVVVAVASAVLASPSHANAAPTSPRQGVAEALKPIKVANRSPINLSANGVNLDECPILEFGYTGGCVAELQRQLNEIQGSQLPTSGRFGPATRAEVIRFQRSHGLNGEGVVGPKTKQKLGASLTVDSPRPASPSASSWNNDPGPKAVSRKDLLRPECQYMSLGSRGWCVAALQVALNKAGYRLDPTGIFDTTTRDELLFLKKDLSKSDRNLTGDYTPGTYTAIGAAMDLQQTKLNQEGKEDEAANIFSRVTCTVSGEIPWAGRVISFVCDDLTK